MLTKLKQFKKKRRTYQCYLNQKERGLKPMEIPNNFIKFKSSELEIRKQNFFLSIVDGNPLGNYHLHPLGRGSFSQYSVKNKNNSTDTSHVFHYQTITHLYP